MSFLCFFMNQTWVNLKKHLSHNVCTLCYVCVQYLHQPPFHPDETYPELFWNLPLISFFSLTRIERKHFLNDYLLITWYSDSELPLLLKYRNKFKTDSPEQLPVKDLCSTELAGGGNITYAAEYKARQKQLGWQHHSHRRVMSCSAGRCHSVKICFVQKYKVTHEEINNASNSLKKKSKKNLAWKLLQNTSYD